MYFWHYSIQRKGRMLCLKGRMSRGDLRMLRYRKTNSRQWMLAAYVQDLKASRDMAVPTRRQRVQTTEQRCYTRLTRSFTELCERRIGMPAKHDNLMAVLVFARPAELRRVIAEAYTRNGSAFFAF